MLALAAALIDGLAEGIAAALPKKLARYFGLLPQRLHLPPGAMGPMGLPAREPVTLILNDIDVYTVDLPLPRGIGVDPWRQAAMLAHRYMPLRPELLAWDLVTVREAGQSVARVFMVRRSVLATALSTGGRVVAITADGSGVRPQFLRLDGRRIRRRLGRMVALSLVVILTVPAVPLFASWILDQQTAHMERKLKALTDDVKAVNHLRDRLGMLSAVLNRDGDTLAQPSRRSLLDEVARLLPDDAWLQDLTLRADGLVLQVNSPDADAVLARFRESPVFSAVRFVAPPDPGASRFGLSLTVATGVDRLPAAEQPAIDGGGAR
ncbi:PilN domain-containing protein [Azospirillum sp. B4]|uniref:PilN domain-containing protein n=1 Tax=Azospirillum sp. B4 TaxID=95605 RepID=UPI0005C840FD|nr:PilN domain-containing protein [Azospirillum sp. B4]